MTISIAERASIQGTPLIENQRATFVWVGENAPKLIGDFTDWEKRPLEMVEEQPNTWVKSLTFQSDAYIEYSFYQNGERLNDPYNTHTAQNGLGEINNYFYMLESEPTPLIQKQEDVLSGEIIEEELDGGHWVVGGKRKVYFYRPAIGESVPLVVVFDGADFNNRAHLPTIVDNLIDQKRIQPIALAMVDNAGTARHVEYACNDAALQFLMSKVLPAARERLNLIAVEGIPGPYAVMGASMGGLMSLYAGLRIPEVFGKVLSLSGAFFENTMVWDLIDMVDPRHLNIWLDVGQYKSFLEQNREMSKQLQDAGFSVGYREFHTGHNYPAWRDHLAEGLEYLFGLKPVL